MTLLLPSQLGVPGGLSERASHGAEQDSRVYRHWKLVCATWLLNAKVGNFTKDGLFQLRKENVLRVSDTAPS